MATWGKIPRWLSSYNTTTQGWEIIPRIAQKQASPTFTLASWNIDHFSAQPVERAKLILDRVLEGPTTPDIFFFQEVHRTARTSILDDPKVRRAFFATDAEDETAFAGVKFTTMTFLSREAFEPHPESESGGFEEHQQQPMLGRVERVKLPSAYRRDALSVDVLTSATTTPDTFLRLVNVHLDSLPDAWQNRTRQMDVLTQYLREPGCIHGVIAGDFNAIGPEDERLVDRREGLVDAWEEVHVTAAAGGPHGHTWGVGVERGEGVFSGRLDKVVLMGLVPKDIQVMRPGYVRVSERGREVSIPWSDHYGLRCTFTIE